MKIYYVRLGIGLYSYEVKAKSLNDAKRLAKRMCIYKTEKVISVS